MKVWEAHRSLSFSLGDAAYADANQIDDGVRFSKELRDEYLYRGMNQIIENVIFNAYQVQLQTQKKSMADLLVERKFPKTFYYQEYEQFDEQQPTIGNYKRYEVLPLDDVYLTKVIYGGRTAAYLGNGSVIPLPVHNSIRVNALLNQRSAQTPDPFCEIQRDKFVIHDPGDRLNDAGGIDKLTGKFLITPIHPADQLPEDDITLEDLHIESLIARASLYAQGDGQEFENVLNSLGMQIGGQ